MVLLTLTPAGREAVQKCAEVVVGDNIDDATSQRLVSLKANETGSPIDHADLIEVSRRLKQHAAQNERVSSEHWRLDVLLRGATLYRPPPIPKPEPSSEYKALMKRLRQEEERKQYERMTSSAKSGDLFTLQRETTSFNPAISHGQTPPDDIDEVTYADVNRQLTLIINVLVSIIACSVAIWVAARHWSVPQRLGLSMSGSGLVAVAEVAIYFGYIRRIKEAKTEESKKVETKEIIDTWVTDRASSTAKPTAEETIRHRKGKHR